MADPSIELWPSSELVAELERAARKAAAPVNPSRHIDEAVVIVCRLEILRRLEEWEAMQGQRGEKSR